MDQKSIIHYIENNVLHIRLNRPDAYNSFNRPMALSMIKCLEDGKNKPEIRCIVIQGEGRAFCAGQDLKEVTSADSPGFKTIITEHYNPIIKLIHEIPKPVIAAVNGVAAGAGANIALACDFVIAKSTASFIQAFVNIGLVPDSGGSYALPRIIGMARAKALCMLGEKLSAADAELIGLIYEAVPEAEFETKINQLSNKLVSLPIYSLGLIKNMLNQSHFNTLEEQLEVEVDSQLKASASDEYKEGVSSFLEKRKPIFKGK